MPGSYSLEVRDCLEVAGQSAPATFHSIVTDPPYGLGFMGRAWDHGVPGVDYWRAFLRVIKPGGYLVAFGGTRTFHRLAVAIEDAGFEIRDTLAWMYGNGFPKSLDVAKAIDKRRDDRAAVLSVTAAVAAARDAAGVTNGDIDRRFGTNGMAGHWTSQKEQPAIPNNETWRELRALLNMPDDLDALVLELNARKGEFGEAWHARAITGEVEEWTDRSAYALTSADGKRRDVPHSREAEAWDGFGTALKPAWEPIILARAPIAGTVAMNVLEYGAGVLNIDGCRIHSLDSDPREYTTRRTAPGATVNRTGEWKQGSDAGEFVGETRAGRWPANVIVDEAAAAQLDAQAGAAGASSPVRGTEPSDATRNAFNDRARVPGQFYADRGGPSRFLYTAKASAGERHAGCENLFWRVDSAGAAHAVAFDEWNALPKTERARGNIHPTVKPLSLMRWLCRLATPPGGRILEPFAGSGSTIAGGVLEGFTVDACEIDASSARVAEARASHWMAGGGVVTSAPDAPQPTLFDR